MQAAVQDRREGRRFRTGAALAVGAVLILGAAAAAVTVGVRFVLHRPQAVVTAPAIAPGAMIEHWGAFGKQVDPRLSPVSLVLPARVTEVGSSNSAQYALLANGEVYAWGEGKAGQLGDGRTANSFTKPVRVQFPHGVRIASIATDVSPWNTALAIDTTGHAWGWGLNAGGDLCLGDTKKYLRPVRLPFWDVTALAGGGSHVTYDAHGMLYSCGANRYGELGDGTTASSTTPVPVSGLDGARVTSLVASWSDTGALLSDGRYYDWGYNRGGQVGDGGTAPAKVPFRVPLPAPVRVAAQGGSLINNGQTIVLTRGGQLYAWGNGMHFQLGNGASGNQQSPIRISPPARVSYATVACGGATCYGVTRSGVVYAWGQGIVGEVGNGMKRPARRPVKIKTGEVTGISATAEDVAVSTMAT